MHRARIWLWLAVAVQIIALAALLHYGHLQSHSEVASRHDQPQILAAAEPQAEATPTLAPPADPLSAWAVARQLVPEGYLIRRIAFAGHGFFVFYSPADSNAIEASFVLWRKGQYALDRIDPASPRDSDICKAPGVSPHQIEPAIQALLRDPVYQQHRPGLNSLILDCLSDQLSWMLLLVPPEGYHSGQTLQTVDLPFLQAERPPLER